MEISVRIIERWKKTGTLDHRKNASKTVPRKLTKEERDNIYFTTYSDEYKDLKPHEVFNLLLDKGIYLASKSSFYRILREHEALRHRSESHGGADN